jgi:predicted DNA-binding protein (MmcQ/YjbR family)
MTLEQVRRYCMALPHTTETVQWENDLVFKIGGKMYAVAALEPGDHWLSFKCGPGDFTDLIERPDVVPAPYLARAQWVALQSKDAASAAELKELLSRAYATVKSKLSKKAQAALGQADPDAPPVQPSSPR